MHTFDAIQLRLIIGTSNSVVVGTIHGNGTYFGHWMTYRNRNWF